MAVRAVLLHDVGSIEMMSGMPYPYRIIDHRASAADDEW